MRILLKKTFGKILKQKRKQEFHLSQEKMAEKCCISLRQYSDLEKSRRLPKLENFIKIAIVCNLNASDFILSLLKSGYEVNDDNNAL